MTFGSLFAGIGGFDLGLERAGMRCVWQVEIDAYARRVLERHWPNVRRWDDVRTFTWSSLSYAGFDKPDVICGGPPCTKTSIAAAIHGKRTGETLWPEMLRIVGHVRPQWVIVEQPPHPKKWREAVEGGLAAAGYHCERLELTARMFGAPHQRRRVFFIANPVRERCQAVARSARPSATSESPWPAPSGGTWRVPGSGNRRVDYGFSDWVDRLRCLGGAVVPQVAEWIGRRIMCIGSDAVAGLDTDCTDARR